MKISIEWHLTNIHTNIHTFDGYTKDQKTVEHKLLDHNDNKLKIDRLKRGTYKVSH